MKKTLTRAIWIFIALTGTTVCLHGQVTIGSGQEPNKGALLDLKMAGNTTKGLAMPRVKLTDKNKLYPMLPNGYNSIEDSKHTGLIVYHNDECTLGGAGLYVWSGTEWDKIGEEALGGLNLSADELIFGSGVGNRMQSVKVSWKTKTASVPTYTTTGLTYSFSPAVLTTSPETMEIRVADMTAGELEANLFARKTGTITFDLPISPCANGGTETKIINVTQQNKGIKVNGKINPAEVLVTASEVGKIATVESNARWKISRILPQSNPAVTANTPGIAIVQGGEKNDGTGNPTTNISYDITVGAGKSRYNFIMFSDAETPKRFADVALSITQCSGDNDLTMRQYVELWEEIYGLDPLNDEPDSDGDIAKNSNRVRWHYTRPDLPANDPKQSIYFSSMFGTDRWMITNLQTKHYTPRTENPTTEWAAAPSLTNNDAQSTSNAYWSYPGAAYNSDAEYVKRERLGLLYNSYAATFNTVTTSQVQGICPVGWHVPHIGEWHALKDELTANEIKYVTKRVTPSRLGEVMKDICEPNANTGRSLGILDGGFSVLLAGGDYHGWYRLYGMFQSVRTPANALGIPYIDKSDPALHFLADTQYYYRYSVRCKKD